MKIQKYITTEPLQLNEILFADSDQNGNGNQARTGGSAPTSTPISDGSSRNKDGEIVAWR